MQRKPILSEVERLETLNWLASQENGLRFLQWLCHDVCNLHVTSVGYEAGVISASATLFNEARKDIWRLLRPYIIADVLAKIECLDVHLDQQMLKDADDQEEEPAEEEANHAS